MKIDAEDILIKTDAFTFKLRTLTLSLLLNIISDISDNTENYKNQNNEKDIKNENKVKLLDSLDTYLK